MCPDHGRTFEHPMGRKRSNVQRAIANLGTLPPGTKIAIRGRSQAMRESFTTLGEGILLAVILVYLLMVANFQSWLEPFIIMMAVPGALAGVIWMLVLTGTTINVESMMGAIMAVGIAVSNSILLVNFANDLRTDKGMGWVPQRAWLSKIEIDAKAADLRFDLAIDASGAGNPSLRDAGFAPSAR